MDEAIIEQFRRLGLPGYESRAYVALVSSSSPLNGYEVAKRSGVPRSTVYQILSKLVDRSIAFEVKGPEDVVEYVPLPPATLFARLREETEDAIEAVQPLLAKVTVPPAVHFTHSVSGRADVLGRARDLVSSATRELLLFVWPEELEDLGPTLRRSEAAGVDIAMIHFGEGEGIGHTFPQIMATPDRIIDSLGCRLLVVVAGREQVLIAGLVRDQAWGIVTDDPAIVAFAAEFVRFDIVMQRFLATLPPELLAGIDQEIEFLRKPTKAVALLRMISGEDQA